MAPSPVAPVPLAPPRPWSHLQCTTMGPAPGMLLWARFTSSRKPRTPVGAAGTPWSGQPKYWQCFTVRGDSSWAGRAAERQPGGLGESQAPRAASGLTLL